MASQQWTENVEPGTAELVRHDDGTVTVRHADPVIAVDPDILDQAAEHGHVEPDGTLRLDTAGTYRYQRVGERVQHGLIVLIYQDPAMSVRFSRAGAPLDTPQYLFSLSPGVAGG